jgi:hypothetical protein
MKKIVGLLALLMCSVQAYQIRVTNLTSMDPHVLVKYPLAFWVVEKSPTTSFVVSTIDFGAGVNIEVPADAQTLVFFDGSRLLQSDPRSQWVAQNRTILLGADATLGSKTMDLFSREQCPLCRYVAFSNTLKAPYNIAGPVPPSGAQLVAVPRLIQPGDTSLWASPGTRIFEIMKPSDLAAYWPKWTASLKNIPVSSTLPHQGVWDSLKTYIGQLKMYCDSFGFASNSLDTALAYAQAAWDGTVGK